MMLFVIMALYLLWKGPNFFSQHKFVREGEQFPAEIQQLPMFVLPILGRLSETES